MQRIIRQAAVLSSAVVLGISTGAAADGVSLQQANTRNYTYVIQERSPFYTRNSTLTATTGGTTVTEIVAIGPDPVPLSLVQSGFVNRASIYQRGTAPNLDVHQDGAVNTVRSKQYGMP